MAQVVPNHPSARRGTRAHLVAQHGGTAPATGHGPGHALFVVADIP